MSLYHKHRPEELDEMLGNDAQLESIRSLLAKPPEAQPHSYIIGGPSGCGKTTLARILAKKYLGANELSIREINTADNRGIDTARDIIDQMQFIPAGGGNLVFIIDECHKTTADWQNAMLKPLEDTPSHVFFFLCTTEPEKLAKAVHTRCTRIQLTAQEPEMLYRLVFRVAKKEGLSIPKEILQLISEQSEGSPRQALVSLDKIAGLDSEEDMRGALAQTAEEQAAAIELCRALMSAKSWGPVKDILAKMRDCDPEQTRRAVLGYMTSVLLKSGAHRAGVALECFAEPTYNTGFPGLVLAAYQTVMGGEE